MMATRKRANRSLSPVDATERLITKKEMEEHPAKYKTCPSVIKKNQHASDSLKEKAFKKGSGYAKIVCFNKPTTLSNLYDKTKKLTYLCQLYKICESIGEGSFGVVYRARNKEDDKLYAIKLMKKYSSGSASYDEVRRLEKIGEHENLVKFYFAWQERSIMCMQIELCALSLAIYTKTNHNLDIDQLWDIFIDMLYALKHLHSRALVHLDIKPDNIMMSEDGKYKLGDFGLLMDLNERRSRSNAVKSAQTSEGDAKYLAKEVLEGSYSCAADIFSLGISMLELAADLVLPVNGPLWHILRDGTYTSDYFKLVPQKIRTVITKMMLPNPTRRPIVTGILCFAAVKRAIAERENKPRINYYEAWKAQNMDDNEVKPIAVCLNPNDRETPTIGTSSNEDEDEDEDEDMGTEPLNTSMCVTPPKRVSQM